jgi:hypothetical protein
VTSHQFHKKIGLSLLGCLWLLSCFGALQAEKPHRALLGTSDNSTRYQISLHIDYRQALFSGREVVQFVNQIKDDLDSVSFQLYPNIGLSEESEQWLSVQRVQMAGRDLRFSLRGRGSVVRVQLLTKLQLGQSAEFTVEFQGRVPRVQREETSLLAHFLEEVSDATREDRVVRDARDIFFATDQAMLLGYFHPLLITQAASPSEQGTPAGAAGTFFSQVANYDVTVRVSRSVTVISSAASVSATASIPGAVTEAGASEKTEADDRVYSFRGDNLRGFALALGEAWQSLRQQVGKTEIAVYFRFGDERLGRQSLEIAGRSLKAYHDAFGEYPYSLLNVIELPMTAGYSGIEFPGLVAVAQAYWIDFDAPEAKRLPNLVRENADLIQSVLEFTLARSIAHQWWGSVVGSDPQRSPWLDEALASYAAAYYFEAVSGRAAGMLAVERHLRSVWQAYRMLGGTDQEVDQSVRSFRNFTQYAAIVQAKGGMMLAALRESMGDAAFFAALRDYYARQQFQIARPEHFKWAILAHSTDAQKVRALMNRWLREKRGDEDIGAPELALFSPQGSKMRTLGRFFVRIGRAAARPF